MAKQQQELSEVVEVKMPDKKMKTVRNRGSHYIELLVGDKVVPFYPGQEVKVPHNFDVPSGIGLYVK